MKSLITSFLVCFVLNVSAQQYWLEPNTFIYQPKKYERGEKALIEFMLGKDFNGQNWGIDRSRVTSIFIHHKRGLSDISKTYFEKGNPIELWLTPEGEDGCAMFT